MGEMSMSLRSTTGFRVKFCRMVVKNRNISIRARPSPAQMRFPARKEEEKEVMGGVLLLATCFKFSAMEALASQNGWAALHPSGEVN